LRAASGLRVERAVRVRGGRWVSAGSVEHLAEAAGRVRSDDELLQNADTAMYRAKALRRSGFASYEPAMRNEALKQLVLETELRRALRADEFEVHYQPIVCIGSGHVVAVEALLRWLHPRLGILQPAAFLGTAEEIGLIVEIGKGVLRTACRQAMVWRQRGLPLRMSVNVSPRQFYCEDLHSSVAKTLYETGLPPHLLELELTENVIMQDRERASITMRALQQLGVGIAIDDFGTGYSSLEYIHSFPIDTLKIDRSFVRDVAKDRRGEAIARTIVLLGRELGLRVIAEGIETIEELSTLRDLGCDEFQGYLVSKPLDAGQCSLFLDERRSLTGEWPRGEPA
ncbi:MAG: EAL domain-containing protein, partial [bacterium]|nr:EAL domain-containing protein [bacterium]